MTRRTLGLFVVVAWAAMAQTPPQLFAIHGVLVRPTTGQPVKRARVTIVRNNYPEQQASIVTGEDGSFHFTDVPPGKYTLVAESHGVNKTFQEDGSFSTGIAVGPGLDSAHIVFPLAAPAALTLDVIDEEGEPVRGAQVLLFQRQIQAGWAQVRLRQLQTCDDRGRVRWANLEAGIYYAAAGGRPWYAQSMMGSQSPESESATKQLDVAFPTTYYPATSNPQEATPIRLTGGEMKIRIPLRAVPAVHITLDTNQAAGNRPGAPSNITASVEAIGPLGIRMQASASDFNSSEHSLELRGLAPGAYLVSLLQYGQGAPKLLGSALVNASGDTHLDAASFEQTEVRGRLLIEAAKDAGAPKAQGSNVFLNSVATGETSYCPLQPDGAFSCHPAGRFGSGSFTPGAYEVRLMSPAGLYMKSIVPQGASFSNGLLQVSYGASVYLTITAALGQTKLDGIALRDGKPAPAAMVLLIPQPGDPDIGIPRDQSDSDGTFTLPNVHPGRYWLLAIDHGRNLEYHNPKVLAPYLAHAAVVDVPATGVGAVQVAVQARRKP